MKSNKINYNIFKKWSILLLMLTIVLPSCEEFVTENPTGEITTDAELSTSQQGEALVTGAYESLDDWTGGADDWGNELPCVFEYWTGKVYSVDAHPQQWKWETDEVDGTLLSDFDNFWNNQYDGIRACNTAIEVIPTLEGMTEAEKSEALGEVRTLRAFYYFNLVRYFGDVVMVTESVEDPKNFQQPRTSLKTIYDEVIIPDLEFAVNESNLEDKPSNGYVTKHVARAILADVYLTCAGYPYQEVATNPDKNWCTQASWSMDEYPVNSQSANSFLNKAKEQLDVLKGQYELFDSYDALRDPAKDFGKEYIFQASMMGGSQDMDNFISSTLPLVSHISMYGSENGTAVPTKGYYNSYSDNDLRKQEKQFFFTFEWVADRWNTENPRVSFATPHVYKYFDEEAIKETANSDLNFTFYRYADILLMISEVNWALKENGQNYSSNDLAMGINKVRERAELSSISAENITLKDILSERAKELIMENRLTWDQRRTRRALVTGDGEFSELVSFFGHQPDRYNYSWSAKHLLSPIGEEEIKYNAEMLQNGGWLPKQPK